MQLNLKPTIIEIQEKKLIGKWRIMSMAENTTFDLWQSFMLQRQEIKNTIGKDLISLQVYNSVHYFDKFDPATSFVKWAITEVHDTETIPKGMEEFILQGGNYAVFKYKGLGTTPEVFEYIFGTWLPSSDYLLDNRPHFEVLGDKYQNNHPDSEEEIWIPIQLKN
jgi:AraC family transcriptional regulator